MYGSGQVDPLAVDNGYGKSRSSSFFHFLRGVVCVVKGFED
jgi:hypothetical protein